MIVSKYGFMDVLTSGLVRVDPSRVAAQVVTGIGFLGAGLILTRGGAVRGLTTAAVVWESAAIGIATGAGLWVFAILVTALHFVVTFGYTFLTRLIPGRMRRRCRSRSSIRTDRGCCGRSSRPSRRRVGG